jgi:cytochrome oxidase Cu insertion factor (SCO1/SenC/PrrC family)
MIMSATNAAPRTRARISLLLIIALFASPVVLAWLLFFVFPQWVPTATSNHGALVKPVRVLPAFELQGLTGGVINEKALQGKWTFIYLHKGACNHDCVEQLYKARQVRLTQGKNMPRLQRLMLWQAEGVAESRRQELAEHFPGQMTALLPAGESPLLDAFAVDAGAPLEQERLYLADPRGNLMMLYEPGSEPRGMVKDLERLLKYSGMG